MPDKAKQDGIFSRQFQTLFNTVDTIIQSVIFLPLFFRLTGHRIIS